MNNENVIINEHEISQVSCDNILLDQLKTILNSGLILGGKVTF